MIQFAATVMVLMGLNWNANILWPADTWLGYTASFGRQGADCAGRGVCSFVENATDGNVRLGYSSVDSVMTLQIINNKVQPSVLERQITQESSTVFPVSDMVFEMEGDYVLPQTVKGHLGIPKELQRIPKGKYKATAIDGLTIIQFKIK